MTEICGDKVTRMGLKTFMKKDKDSSMNSAPLIQFVPKKSDKSDILNDYQISNILQHFPPMIRPKDWDLVFSINRDGVSVGTFYERCRDFSKTLLVVQDTHGWVFGGFCNETWKASTKFYGTGENFLFKFKDGNKAIVYNW